MLKSLNKNDTQVTPYIATKDWQLSNIDNSDLILSEAGNPIIYEHVSLEPLTVSPNDDCDIAREDQSLDLALFREGLKINGIFYPQLDPINVDGTYKRMVYTQIKTTFYNNYRDPTKMWGLEKIDFDSSETKKFLSDSIKILDIPTEIMGEKIIPNTVIITDNSIDDVHSITDDGNNNLFAGTNLFSKIQEIGDYKNTFISGSISFCNSYFDFNVPKNPYSLTASQVGNSLTISLNWLDAPADGFVVERSSISNKDNWEDINPNWENESMLWNDTGSVTFVPFSPILFTGPGITQSYDTNVIVGIIYYYRVYAFNVWGNSSFSNVAEVEII
jgi:hypothetical protein